VDAILEPLKVEKRVPLITVIRLNLPGIRPTHLSRVSIIRGARPDLNITSPMRIKRGTGSMVKLITEP